MQSLKKIVNECLKEVRSNRNLQYGLLAIIGLVCVELGLGWSDTLSVKEKQLQQLRSELRDLRSQSRDEAGLRQQLIELERTQKIIDERLWIVSSEPVGQARLKDWLTAILNKAGAKNFNLVLSSPRVLGAREGSGEARTTAESVSKPEAVLPSGAAKEGIKNLREVRATLTLVFTPASLEQILFDIEGGKPLATIESLNVSRRDRKVEMTVRVLMQIGQEETPEKKSLATKMPEVDLEKKGAEVLLPPSANKVPEGKP